HSSVTTKARSSAGHTWLQPAWTAWMTISASGDSSPATTMTLTGPSSQGNRRRRPETSRRRTVGLATPLTGGSSTGACVPATSGQPRLLEQGRRRKVVAEAGDIQDRRVRLRQRHQLG